MGNDKNINLNISEDEPAHRDTDEEATFLNDVASGNMEKVHENCDAHRFTDSTGVGSLSADPVQNLKYHMVVTAALVTRKCIKKGLEPERAFRMSDYYIRKLDSASSLAEVELIHNSMVLDFTGKMRFLKRDKGLSRPITRCVNYIYSHIYERITVTELAAHSGVSESYLSREFVKELGIPVSNYIREKKVELAIELLANTDESILDIACKLSFSSQSHFIDIFKSATGMTPAKYRASGNYHIRD